MKKLLVIGNPINHSKSPSIHNIWLKKYKIEAFYDRLKVNKDGIKNVIKKIKSNELIGINVTLPHKKNVIKYLDLIEEDSVNSGAVNTIYKKNSKIIGTNTDGDGFLSSVKNDANFIINKSSNVFIVGAGGAARGIVFSLIKKNVNKIFISNRTSYKKENLIEHVKSKTNYNKLIKQNWSDRFIPSDVDLVINTSSFGMIKGEHLSYDLSGCKKNLLVYDIIYSPKETCFLKDAKSKGFKIQNGMGMLIRQAALSFYKWFGKNITENEITKMMKSFEEQL